MNGLSILVVGGGAGLGAEVVRGAAAEGARAIGIIDANETAAQTTIASVQADGLTCCTLAADIGTRQETQRAFSAAVDLLGPIDTLVNCAAIYPRRPILEISDDDWDAANAVNVKGTYHMMVAAVEHMRAKPARVGIRGRIVNITSVDAFKAHPQNAHYAATKAAVASLTRSFASECAGDGILINSVAPAGMATEKARAAGFLDELAAASPLGRAAGPEEIASWVLMAGGARNTYMTGENIIVSGGYIYA